jgi:hypothetical protein
MGGKKTRRDTGSKVGAAIVQCGEEERNEEDGRAEREVTVLCVEGLRGSHGAKRSAHQQPAAAASSSSSCGNTNPTLVALCRVQECRDQGQEPASLPALPRRARPFPVSLCLSAAVSPKRNGQILACTASSHLIRQAGLRGSRPERADPRKAFQVLCPKWLAPAGQVSDPRCRWRNNPASPVARQPRGRPGRGADKRTIRRGDPDLLALLIFFRGRSSDEKGLVLSHLQPNPEPQASTDLNDGPYICT